MELNRALTGLAGIVLAAGMAVPASATDFPVYVCGDNSRIEQMQTKTAFAKSLSNPYSPIIPEGTRKIIYTIVDTENNPNYQTQEEINTLMQNAEAYFERVSHGKLDIEITSAGRVYIPYNNLDNCDWNDPFTWAEAVDEIVGQDFDLYDYDGRVYFHSGTHSCNYGGLGTISGNFDLPIYTGGFANQSWIFNEMSELAVIHELGHNWSLGHARIMGTPENPEGEEYGDHSSLMGWANWSLPYPLRELRGMHGVNRRQLSWLDEKITLREGEYRIYASELENASGEQVLVIPHPRREGGAYFLTYRTGGDGIHFDGSPAPLEEYYTQGVGIRLSGLFRRQTTEPGSQTTELEVVLQDDEVRLGGNPYDEEGFFSVRQIEHDDESVLIRLDFHPAMGDESLNAYNCHDGYDNDGDGKMDFGGGDGMEPEGPICAFPWNSMSGFDRTEFGNTYIVECRSEFSEIDGFGPQGLGLVHTERTSDGWYTGWFEANKCGTNTITCDSSIPGTTILDDVEMDVNIYCPTGKICSDDGECYRPRVRRATGRRSPITPRTQP